jgi:hypothetical protein
VKLPLRKDINQRQSYCRTPIWLEILMIVYAFLSCRARVNQGKSTWKEEKAQELFRMGGENSMLWTAEPWTDTPSDQADESLESILAVLSKDRMPGTRPRRSRTCWGLNVRRCTESSASSYGADRSRRTEISTMSQTKCSLEGFGGFGSVSASTFSTGTGRTRKAQ